MKNRIVSLFPYKGGKTKLVRNIIPLIEWSVNHHELNAFCELCGGSGKYITNLNLPNNIYKVYCELDEGVTKLVTVLQDREATKLLIKKLLTFNFTQDEFYFMRDNYYSDNLDIITSAAYTYVFIRLSWKNALTNYGEGKIKGKEQRFRKEIKDIIDKRFDIALKGVKIIQGDCLNFLSQNIDRDDCFVTLDVPYPNTEGYPSNDRFGEFDYGQLIGILLETKMKVLINGYDTDIYRKLEQAGWQKIEFDNNSRRKGTRSEEFLWINFDVSQYTMERLRLKNTNK
ncbi:DNA adenine methylase [Clostridium sp.]|uniref:DNA adenine methylase n=1 Tax=Clostridium sp. TaxID=1506 RepID=UPI00321639C7